jgi:hypothetical protein
VEHVVFFPAPDGAPAFRRVATLEEAVHLVEHLRNVEGVAEVGVHPLGAEVPLAFRAWYRVEVPGAEAAAAVPAVEAAVEAPVEAAVEAAAEAPVEAAVEAAVEAGEPVVPAQAEPAPELLDAAPNGHSADGVKSLGFFA